MSSAIRYGIKTWLFALLLSAAMLGLGIYLPSQVFASFSRPYLRQIQAAGGSPLHAGGLSTNAADDLWVGESSAISPFRLDEFSSSGAFLTTAEIEGLNPPATGLTPPEDLAINMTDSLFYVTGPRAILGSPPAVEVFAETGAFVSRIGMFGKPNLAVDNSSTASAGAIYVAHGHENPSPPNGDGLRPGIEKLDASGKRINFSASASYIVGGQIIGVPGFTWEQLGPIENWSLPAHITVGPDGNIYSVDTHLGGHEEIDEYTSGGLFLRAFTAEESPGVSGRKTYNGFGGEIKGIAVDPFSGHVLVSVGGEGVSDPGGVIDEFDASGHFLDQISEGLSGGSLNEPREITVDSHGQLYVVVENTEHRHVIETFGPGHFLPSFKPVSASKATPTSVTLNSMVNPEGLPLSDCYFEYVPRTQFEVSGFNSVTASEEAPCEPNASALPCDANYHAVQADVGGLSSGTIYEYRLVATTMGQLGGASASITLSFTAPHSPRIDSTSVDGISSAFVGLHAEIDPEGASTSYHFEYLTENEFEANGQAFVGQHMPRIVPLPDADIGSGGQSGSADALVGQQIGGLLPGTTYRFRVVATNSVGSTQGEVNAINEEISHTFTTLPEVLPGLADGRVYELLSPPSKGSAEDMFAPSEDGHDNFAETDYGVASESGNAFLLRTLAAFGPSPASSENAYVFSHSSGGWRSTALAPSTLGVQSVSPDVYEPANLTRIGIEDQVGSAASTSGSQLASLVGSPGGSFSIIHADSSGGHNEFEALDTHIVGASQDLSHVVLESLDHTLAPQAEAQDPGTDALYEWSGGGECTAQMSNCRLINVDSEGVPVSKCGAILGQSHIPGTSHDAVSADGTRDFFTAPDPYVRNAEGGGCWNGKTINAPEIYMGTGSGSTMISAPQEGAPESSPHHFALFVGASEDGARVFFLTEGQLTANDEGIHDLELYEYDNDKPEGDRLSRVSAGESGDTAAGVLTVPAISADGTTVYFTASGRLTGSAPASIVESEAYLYRYDSVTGVTSYVTSVYRNDYPRVTASGWTEPYFTSLRPDANWYTTPDGRYLLFATSREQTGYNTVEAEPLDCPDLNGGAPNGRCDEVYRYDANTGVILCVSCDSSGAPPISNALFADSESNSIQFGAGPVRAMSNDGADVFFDTGDSLVPTDTNGTLDVYQWHEGTISLISSGTDHSPSFFLGTSTTGSDVFFGTHARLVAADTDTAGDLYDARVDGVPLVPAETSSCVSDACSIAAPGPIDSTPASFAFEGPGDLRGESVKTARPLTRAQKLARALRACRKEPKKRKRVCEKQARKLYHLKTKTKVKSASLDSRKGF